MVPEATRETFRVMMSLVLAFFMKEHKLALGHQSPVLELTIRLLLQQHCALGGYKSTRLCHAVLEAGNLGSGGQRGHVLMEDPRPGSQMAAISQQRER